MRLQPVAHAGLRRVATRDVAFSNGMVVPAGATVFGSQLSLMNDPAWGWMDPDAFRPVRPPRRASAPLAQLPVLGPRPFRWLRGPQRQVDALSMSVNNSMDARGPLGPPGTLRARRLTPAARAAAPGALR
jgi:cytochrome P450